MIHSRPGGVCGVMYALAMEPLRLSGGAQRRFGGAPVSSPSSMSDHIAAIARSGDRAAFGALFLHFAPRVKAYLMRMGTSPEAAEELAQETLLALWRRAASFDPAKAQASTWIFAIARNLRIDLARRERRALPGEDPTDAPSAPVEPEAELAASEKARRIGLALADLPTAQAEVVRLAFFSDKPHSEIAGELALPLGTVKSRLRLALGRLRIALEEGR